MQENYPKDWQLKNRKLFSMKGESAALCTPQTVTEMYDKLQDTLAEVGLLKDGVVVDQAAAALWCCDEKGLESNEGPIMPKCLTLKPCAANLLSYLTPASPVSGAVKFQRVVVPNGVAKATTDIGSASFGHVTLLPFISAGGNTGPANIVMQGSSLMKSWAKVWPEAHVAATEKASCTATLFCEFVLLWAKHCREVLRVPRSQELVLLCDSGGGALIHLSVNLTLLCHQLGVRLFMLGPYLTPRPVPESRGTKVLGGHPPTRLHAEPPAGS